MIVVATLEGKCCSHSGAAGAGYRIGPVRLPLIAAMELSPW